MKITKLFTILAITTSTVCLTGCVNSAYDSDDFDGTVQILKGFSMKLPSVSVTADIYSLLPSDYSGFISGQEWTLPLPGNEEEGYLIGKIRVDKFSNDLDDALKAGNMEIKCRVANEIPADLIPRITVTGERSSNFKITCEDIISKGNTNEPAETTIHLSVVSEDGSAYFEEIEFALYSTQKVVTFNKAPSIVIDNFVIAFPKGLVIQDK